MSQRRPQLFAAGPTRRGLSRPGLAAALAAVLAGLVPALAAQEPPDETSRSQTYYDRFAHGGERPSESASVPVDLAAVPVVSWTHAAGGTWSDSGNWSGGKVPGEGDHAVIAVDGTYTVTLDGDVRVSALTLGAESGIQTLTVPRDALALQGPATVGERGVLELAGGRITGDGDLVVHGRVVWSGGSMSGRGRARIAAGGHLELAGDERKVLSLRHVENAGTLAWRDGGNLMVTFAAQIRNLEGGDFEVASGALLDVYGPEGPAVHNAGVLRVTAAGVTTFETPLTNSGTVEIGAGGLQLLAGYSQTETGELRLALAGDVLRISGEATLGGGLELVWPAGSELAGGGVEVMTFGHREGDFARLTGLVAPTGEVLEPRFSDGGLILRPAAGGAP